MREALIFLTVYIFILIINLHNSNTVNAITRYNGSDMHEADYMRSKRTNKLLFIFYSFLLAGLVTFYFSYYH